MVDKTSEHRIFAAIGAMPYGALVHKSPRQRGLKVLTLDEVADYLEGLRDVLERVSETNAVEKKELETLRDEIATGGRLLKRLMGS